MKMILRSLTMVSFYVVLAGFLSSAVCEGKDELDCAALTAKYTTKVQEISTTILNGGQINCTEATALFDELISLLNKGKDCEAIKTALEASGYKSVDAFIAEYESIVADIGC